MTPKKYKALTDKIVEANPEIMELKFGCVVKVTMHKTNAFNYELWNVVACDDRKLILRPVGENIDTDLQSVDIKYIEILGRDITLEDILNLLEQGDEDTCGYDMEEIMYKWTFGEPLHLQSEETQDWLYSVIVKK